MNHSSDVGALLRTLANAYAAHSHVTLSGREVYSALVMGAQAFRYFKALTTGGMSVPNVTPEEVNAFAESIKRGQT